MIFVPRIYDLLFVIKSAVIELIDKIQKIDDKVLDKIKTINRPILNKIMIVITSLGTFGTVWFVIAIIMMITKTYRSVGVNLVIGLAITHLLGEFTLKRIVCRSRPCHKLDDEELIIDRPKYYSFPSGHPAASFCVVGVVFLRCQPIIWVPILILALLIGFSRLYLRVHFLTDVLAGALLGFICGCASVGIMVNLVINYGWFRF